MLLRSLAVKRGGEFADDYLRPILSGSLGLFIGGHTMGLKMRKGPALNTDIF